MLIVLIGAFEWSRLIKLAPSQTIFHIAASFFIGLLLVYITNTTYETMHEKIILCIMALASITWLVVVPLVLFKNAEIFTNKLSASITGIILLSATLIAFIRLHQIGPLLLLGLIATVSIADSAAYFSGKQFGKHKLAPSISPGKTWEGVIGAIVAVAIYGFYLNTHFNYGGAFILGLISFVALSVMGDLFESKLKRQANMKDSGSILPGHGGILDRIDGIMPTATIALFFIIISASSPNGLSQ